jgi:hypothetical protein
MQHRLKAVSGAARTRIVPTEALDQFLIVADDTVATLNP